ncbi:MAG: TetR/AcrR family transcriptional regulator [Magnetococcales bacterium]|nr:TetR/AcrR family transcriptional regulator [Magnetococcales bacterium]
MARRTDHSRDELIDLVLNHSQQIIEQKGVAALTARSIAAAIGYSPGTLYNLFNNIDEIILHLNGRTLADLHRSIAKAIQGRSGRAQLDHLISAYLDFSKTAETRWALLTQHHPPRDEPLPDWYQEQVEQLLEQLASILRLLLPGCGNTEIKHSAGVLWCGLNGISTNAGQNKLPGMSPSSLDEMARSLAYNYISGLKRVA